MLMIDFLSDPNNFSIVTGSAAKGRPMRSGQRLTKTHGFQLMADFVNTKNDAKATVWTGDMAKSRYEAYCIQYKKAKRWECTTVSNTSGNGITVGDIKIGIDTIDKKLEAKCQFFEKMDALFGERPNIMPSHIMEVGGHDYESHEGHTPIVPTLAAENGSLSI
ncbi:hypothetical protein LEN26_009542 [Aphanomyces euteiches]|nr:hypothetical protein LEN26_009542 [Aphanomyces euteiches]